MATNYWKKFEKSDFFQRAKLRMRQMYGREPRFDEDLKVKNTIIGDWGFPADRLPDEPVVYTFGVCDDIDFELALIEQKQARVFAFDPTPYAVEWIAQQQLPDQFCFTPLACAAEDGEYFLYPLLDKHGRKSAIMFSFHQQEEDRDDGVRVPALTVSSTMTKMQHDHIDLLKMDVEGAEYEVLDSVLSSGIRPAMIMVEFHHRFKGIGKEKTINAVAELRDAGYQIGYISPAGREMCFIHST
ncbi:FkbM family methyltransferase [Marinicella sediminis]|uniref:FkbM family methyltransferase n=1 Tax=Marinicella sediminis TaxID=1792834 RepID=A0ABV7J974_9GAMM|nr:FkbM family methyltransferase [Marinicella sediminis]